MARDGSGTYSLPVAAFVNGATIDATDVNSDFSDIASALTQSLSKDGQTTPTANQPMATFKHTGVGAATARTDYARADQVIGSVLDYAIDTGSATAYTIAPSPGISAYVVGQRFAFKAINANTGADPTLAVNSLTAGIIYWPDGTSLVAGDIAASTQTVVQVASLSAGTPTFHLQTPRSPGTFIKNSLLTTRGDIITRSASAPQRLALGTAGQVLKSDGTDATWGTAPDDFRNRFINGDFSVDQRNEGASQTFTAAAAVAYTVDRWYASCTGANVTGQRVTGTSPNRYAYKFTGAASVTGVLFGQRIEVANISDLVSTDVVVSMQVKSSSLTSLTWTAYYANSADDFSAKTQIATGTISSVSSTLASKSFTFNTGANAGNGIAIEITGGALLATHTLQFENLQIETGTTATSFERIPPAISWMRCQRYYAKSYETGTVAGTSTKNGIVMFGITGGYQGTADVKFRFEMRAAPTISYWDGAGNASKISYIGTATTTFTDNVSPHTAPFNISTKGFIGGSQGSASATNYGHYTATAEL